MNMDVVEQDVDAALCAAARIDEAHRAVMAAKDKSLKVIYEKNDWVRYKEASELREEAKKAKRDAESAYAEVRKRRQSVIQATYGYEEDHPITIERKVVERVYDQAKQKVEVIAQLVEEVRQNFRDALDPSSDAFD